MSMRPRTALCQFNKQTVGYLDALELQRRCQAILIEGKSPFSGFVLLLEHSPVYTFGRASSAEHVLDKTIQVVRTERGGEVTFHGPGQITAYMVLDLKWWRKDLHWLVSGLEKSVIRSLETGYGIRNASSGAKGKTGVWIGDEKIAAIGLSCKRWVTMHGFALNVNNKCMGGFNSIVPCGLQERRVTTIESQTNMSIDMQDAQKHVIQSLEQVFGMEFVRDGDETSCCKF